MLGGRRSAVGADRGVRIPSAAGRPSITAAGRVGVGGARLGPSSRRPASEMNTSLGRSVDDGRLAGRATIQSAGRTRIQRGSQPARRRAKSRADARHVPRMGWSTPG